VHHNKEVSLKLTIEVSQLGKPVIAPDGSSQPTIGTRTITSTIRLKDGETNFLAGLIRKDLSKGRSSIPFLGDLPLIGSLFTANKVDNVRTDLFLTLTPHIIRSPQITEEDLVPIWVGTENNVSFSGLNTRLESPNATGSPFDAPPAPASRVAPRPVGAPASTLPNIPQGSGPNDPFKQPAPAPTPAPLMPQSSQVPRAISAPAPASSAMAEASAVSIASAAAVADAVPSGPVLQLEATSGVVAPGEVSVVNLTGGSGLAPLATLELTVEWDPAVAEVTGIAPGPWRNEADAAQIGFEADRTAGRAHLHFARTGEGGLPDGVLAKLAVRGAAPGTTLVRVTAGSAGTTKGPAAAPVVDAVSLTVKASQ
jgi:general secretion pathway protein D